MTLPFRNPFRRPAGRPDAADALGEYAERMARFRSQYGNFDPDLYAVAKRYERRELSEREYIFELGRVYERANRSTRERIESLLGDLKGPNIPAERPPSRV